MSTTVAAGLYPYVLPARAGDPFGLTVDNAASVGIALALVYFTLAYRLFLRRQYG